MQIEEVIQEAQDVLSNNQEWKNRYNDYVDIIKGNQSVIESHKKKFYEKFALRYYLSVTEAKKATENNLCLDVRYRGQSVATIKATSDNVTLSTKFKNSTNKEYNNKRDFDCEIKLDNVQWRDKKASEFRAFFKNRPNSRNNKENKGNEEHNVENLLLSEFSKKSTSNKAISKIQPVKISGIRFGMPTPLSASNPKNLEYAGHKGGEIDILARTGRGRATYLTVIEVKDENTDKELPQDALKQAVRYAVFIRELLRSDCGKDWYNLLGFKGEIPKKLTIRVACAMPDDKVDKNFANHTYLIGNDKIECHYIYFKYDGMQLSHFETSLP